MPIFKIQTAEKIADREAFMKDATGILSDVLQKSTDYIMVILEHTEILFAGDNAPAAYAELKSIRLPEEKTTEISEKLCEFMVKRLGIPKDRIYIEFTNAEAHLLGWNGRTFKKHN